MSERDPFAPIIGGFDCSGLTGPYSLRCEPFFTDGENGGTLLDGSTVHDILASKVRFSWALTAMTPAQYAALIAATEGAEALDTVSAYVYDATIDAVRLANFHVTRPVCRTVRNMGQMWAIPQSELVLEEASPIARFAVTPPAKTVYDVGDALDLTGVTVTQYDRDGAVSDITADCSFDPPAGTTLDAPGSVTVSVSFDGATIGAVTVLAVKMQIIVASLPYHTDYAFGEPLDLSGLRVIAQSPAGYAADITDECFSSPDAGSPMFASSTVAILRGGERLSQFAVSVSADHYLVRRGNWWALDEQGTLYVFCRGDVGSYDDEFEAYGSPTLPPWHNQRRDIRAVIFYPAVTDTGGNAFHFISTTIHNQYENLTDITFLGPCNIGYSSFSGAPVTRVDIPSGATYIGRSAFSNCSSLASVSIPESVKRIGDYAFFGCRLQGVTIADDCIVGERAFPDNCVIYRGYR